MKTLLILTGWNRGLGEGILQAYADIHGRDLVAVCIARTDNQALANSVSRQIDLLQTFRVDLSDHVDLNHLVTELDVFSKEQEWGFGMFERSVLINNAAVIGPIETLAGVEDRLMFHEQAAKTFSLNCIAPALLSGWFISKVKESGHSAYIVNISSGASQSPMAGASVYSMTKSALNMLCQSLLSEQQVNNVKIIALSPGMVETNMQKLLRSQPKERLPNVNFFKEADNNRSHIEVGKIIASLNFDDLENGSYHHIEELYR